MGLLRTLGGIAGTLVGSAIAPGAGTAVGGLLGSQLGGAIEGRGGGGNRGAIGNLNNPNFGLTQFLRIARASAPSAAEFSALGAQRGLSRDSAGALAALQSSDARLQAGTRALDAFGQFRLGTLGQAAQIQFGQQQASAERRTSFLNNVLGIGAGLLGQHLGRQSADQTIGQQTLVNDAISETAALRRSLGNQRPLKLGSQLRSFGV